MFIEGLTISSLHMQVALRAETRLLQIMWKCYPVMILPVTTEAHVVEMESLHPQEASQWKHTLI